MPREITAYSNPLIKWVRDLRDKRHRKQARQFLAEGLRILTEAKETGRLPTLLFFAKPSADHPLVRQLVRAVELAGGEKMMEWTDGRYASMSDMYHEWIMCPAVQQFERGHCSTAKFSEEVVRDLDLPVVIHLSPTVREADGLALSSRNAYLSPEDRGRAPALYQALTAGCQVLAGGDYRAGNVRAAGMEVLARAEGIEVEYLEAVDLNTLGTPLRPGHPVLVAGAVKVGRTRLIDNIIHPHGALAALNNGVTSS